MANTSIKLNILSFHGKNIFSLCVCKKTSTLAIAPLAFFRRAAKNVPWPSLSCARPDAHNQMPLFSLHDHQYGLMVLTIYRCNHACIFKNKNAMPKFTMSGGRGGKKGARRYTNGGSSSGGCQEQQSRVATPLRVLARATQPRSPRGDVWPHPWSAPVERERARMRGIDRN